MNLINNAKWNAFSQLFKIAVQLVNIVFLAKIIPPSEYGLMAMALVVVNLGNLLRDLGTSSAIIKTRDLSHSLINSVFWLNLFMGIGLMILISILSPLIADIYNQKKLIPILISLSVIFPLSSSAAAHLALLQRDSKFKIISAIEILSALISLLVAILAALNHFGVYSLILQSITLNLISACSFWIVSKWKPTREKYIDLSDIRSIFSFTYHVSMFNIVNYFSRNADSFIIGKYMSVAILGGYNLAYRIMLFPLQSLTFVASRSLYPVLSHHQDDTNKVSSIYLNCVFVVLLISAPLMGGLAVISKPFVDLIFGPQWFITAEVLKWLAPTAIIQSVLSTTGSVFMAKGRTSVLLRLGVFGTVLQVLGFIIGAQYNIEIFVQIYLLTNIINFFPAMFFVLKVLGTTFVAFFKKILPIALSTIIMMVSVALLVRTRFVYNESDFFVVNIAIVTGVLLYVFCMFVFSKDVRKYLFSKLKA